MLANKRFMLNPKPLMFQEITVMFLGLVAGVAVLDSIGVELLVIMSYG